MTASIEASTFSEFVQSRGGALWRTAWLLTGDRGIAEDLLQTALVKAWPHHDRVSRDGSFEAYVRTALVTTYAGWRRRRWWSETPTDDSALAGLPPSPGSRDLDGEHDLRRALGSLSERQRAVVVLRYFCDLTEAETARSLGCSVGTVKTHHSRAMERLRGSALLRDPDASDSPADSPAEETR